MAAALRKFLVLQLDCRDTRVLVLPNGPHHVQRCAVTGVGVGDQRDIAEGGDHHPGAFRHLGLGDKTDVGQPESGRGDAGAREVRGDVSGAPGEMCGDSVEDAWRDDEFTAVQQVAKALPGGCGWHETPFSPMRRRPARREGRRGPDVVEAIKLDHRAFDRGGAVAVGDPVGQSMELDDELIVVAGIVGCAVRLGDANAVHGPVVGGDGQVGGEPFGDVGAVTRLVQVDLGAVDETPDVVRIEAVQA